LLASVSGGIAVSRSVVEKFANAESTAVLDVLENEFDPILNEVLSDHEAVTTPHTTYPFVSLFAANFSTASDAIGPVIVSFANAPLATETLMLLLIQVPYMVEPLLPTRAQPTLMLVSVAPW
jgi:hypothetical protein